MIHSEIISVIELDYAGEGHYTWLVKHINLAPGLSSILADRICHIPIGMTSLNLGEHEESLYSLLVSEFIDAGAIDQALPFLGSWLVMPCKATIIAEANKCRLPAVTVRPSTYHCLLIVHEHCRRMTVVKIRCTGGHNNLPLLLAGDVRPREIGFIPLSRQ